MSRPTSRSETSRTRRRNRCLTSRCDMPCTKSRNPHGLPCFHGHPHMSNDCDVYDGALDAACANEPCSFLVKVLTSGFSSDTHFAVYGLDGLTLGWCRLALGKADRVGRQIFGDSWLAEPNWKRKDPSPFFTDKAWITAWQSQLHKVGYYSTLAYAELLLPSVIKYTRMVEDPTWVTLAAIARFVNSGFGEGYGHRTNAAVRAALMKYKPSSGRAKWIIKNVPDRPIPAGYLESLDASFRRVAVKLANNAPGQGSPTVQQPAPPTVRTDGPSVAGAYSYAEFFGRDGSVARPIVENAISVLKIANSMCRAAGYHLPIARGYVAGMSPFDTGSAVILYNRKSTWDTAVIKAAGPALAAIAPNYAMLNVGGRVLRTDDVASTPMPDLSREKLVSVTSTDRGFNVDPRPLWAGGRVPTPADVIRYLDVEKNPRYVPANGKTYCNIYAQDFAVCMGLYMPRRHQGKEVGASALPAWLAQHSLQYMNVPERDVPSIKNAEQLLHRYCVSNNTIGVISCAGPEVRGHVSIVLPYEQRNEKDDLLIPQTQTGRTPFYLFYKRWYTDALFNTRVFAILKPYGAANA